MKRKNKSIVSLVLCILMIFSVAGCKNKKSDKNNTSKTATTIAKTESDSAIKEMGDVLDEAGTYALKTVEGDVKITAEDVTLKDTVIDGNLLIAESVGEGNVYLENVKVKGKTIVNGGGENSIIFLDCEIYDVVVDKKDGKVRIVAKGDTKVGNIELHSGAKLEEDELTGEGYGNVSVGIEVPDEAEIIFEGNFNEITVSGENARINLEESKVTDLNIAETAKGTTVEVSKDSTITNLEVNAKADVKGKGKIENAKITADDVTIEQKPENTQVEEDTDDENVTKGNKNKNTNSTAKKNSTGKKKSDKKDKVSVTGVRLNKIVAKLNEGQKLQLTATVKPNNASEKKITWETSDNKIATVDNTGKVKAIKAGKVTITVKTKDGNKITRCKITVVKKEVHEKEVPEKEVPEKEVPEKEIPEKKVPEINKATADKTTNVTGTAADVVIKVATKDIADGTEVIAELINAADNSTLNPAVKVSGKIASNAASLTLPVTAEVAEGSYKIKVTCDGEEKSLDYKVSHKAVPAINSITSDKTTNVEGTVTDVKVVVNATDIKDGTEVIAELVNESDNSSLNPAVKVSGKIASNAASLTLPVTAEVAEGSYKIKVTCDGKEKLIDYKVSHKAVPEINNATADQATNVEGTATDVKVTVSTTDIKDGTEVIAELVNESDNSSLNPAVKVSGKIASNAASLTLPVTAEVAEGSYKIKVTCAGEEKFLDYLVSKKEETPYKVDWENIVNYEELDTGIFWFDENNQPHRDGNSSSPFDKTKPTIIFVHGWLPDSVKLNYASDFLYIAEADENISVNTAKAWIEDGYNVGMFNWCQLSDEPATYPYEAEAKIWTSNYPDVKMRWKKTDDTFVTENLPKKSAAEIFYDAYVEAMKGFEGDKITIAGHSLGNQMAIRLADLVDKHIEKGDIAPELMPDRVALLDPYYTDAGSTYVDGKSPGKVASEIVERLINKNNVVFEMYKSSDLTSGGWYGDRNEELEKLSYYFKMKTYYVNTYAEQHSASTGLYFWSRVYSDSIYSLDNADIGSRMGSAFRWGQTEGDNTINPNDDKNEPIKNDTYVPQTDISLFADGLKLTKTAKENCEEININIGSYKKIETEVMPLNATSKIVAFEKVSGDTNSIQFATNGIVKGLKEGKVLLKVFSKNLTDDGAYSNTIEKYVRINVEKAKEGQLPQVASPKWVGDTIAWKDVENETNYKVNLLKDGIVIYTQTVDANVEVYDFTEKIKAEGDGNYKVTVQAKGDGNGYLDGAASLTSEENVRIIQVKLGQVEKPVWDEFKITWEDVENESNYEVTLLKNGEEKDTQTVQVDTVQYDFTDKIKDLGEGKYTVTIEAKGDGIKYLDGEVSIKSDERTIAVLAQIEKPVWNGNKITWTDVNNEVGYEVILLKDNEVKDTQTVQADIVQYDFTDKIKELGEGIYTVTVQAKGDGTNHIDGVVSLTSQENDKIIKVKLGQVTKPVWDENKITWTDIENGTEYEVTLIKEGEVKYTQIVEADIAQYDFTSKLTELGSGPYTVKVQAKGNGMKYLDGEVSIESDERTIETLAQVDKPVWNGKKISWTDVDKESGYKIILKYKYNSWWSGTTSYDKTVEVKADVIEYDFTTILDGLKGEGYEDYTVTVQAEGDGMNYLDGKESNQSEKYVE